MYSSCCGAYCTPDMLDYQRCPKCKENCDFTNGSENDSHLEYVTVTMPKFKFNWTCKELSLIANIDYTIKEVKIVDDFFKDDPTYQTLKSESNKAYKRLKEYEFKERNR